MSSKYYPFASGSEYTASHAISSSYADNAKYIRSVGTASFAGEIQTIVSGSPAATDVCIITYEEYLQILAGTHTEFCP